MKTGMTPAQTVTTYMTLVTAQLSVSPLASREWRVIAKRLRAAADSARKIAVVAERMEHSSISTEVETPISTD